MKRRFALGIIDMGRGEISWLGENKELANMRKRMKNKTKTSDAEKLAEKQKTLETFGRPGSICRGVSQK